MSERGITGRCLVMGGGITGMSAAIFLAREGRRVTLVEKSPLLAPLLRGFRREGVLFETGFHFAGGLEPGGLLRLWLQALGLDLPFDQRLEEEEIACLNGERYRLPVGEEGWREWTARHFPASQEGMARLFARVREGLSRSPYTSPACRDHPLSSVLAPSAPLNECLTDLDPDLAHILKTRCMLYGVSPRDALWRDFMLVAGSYFFSRGTVPGGGPAFVAAWERALEESGVSVIRGRGVKALELSPAGRLCGARLEDGEALEADQCVVSCSPTRLLDVLPAGALRPAYCRHLSAMRETREPFILYGVGDVPPLTAWYVSPDADVLPSVETEKPAFSVMSGPKGEKGQACLAMAVSDRRSVELDGPAYRDWKAETARRFQEKVETALPELRGRWRVLDVSTGASLRRWVPGSGGGIYGLIHDRDTLPLPPLTRIPGLVLAGQSLLLPGMLGCLVSAAIAADILLGGERTLERFRRAADE